MMQYSLRAKLIILSITLLGISQTINPVSRQAMAQALPSPLSNSQLKQEKTNLSLYGGVRTRTPIVQWYLEEIAVPYQYISLDIKQQEHRQPEFLEINPMGKLPAIVNGEFKLWESGAILLYLADKYMVKYPTLPKIEP